MRRLVLMLALAAFALSAVAGVGLALLFHTPPGRHFLASLIEPSLGDALGGRATIGSLGGALPNNLILSDVSFRSEDADWLRIDRVEMDWSALALLGDKIRIRKLDVDGVHLLQAPPETARAEDEAAAFTLPSLPRRLPDLAVKQITIADIDVDESVFGAPLHLDASGGVVMHGGMLSLMLNATSAGDTDTINATMEFDQNANHGAVDIVAASASDGFLASLAGLDGELFLKAAGEAPLNAFKMRMEAAAGEFGAATLAFAGDLLKSDQIVLSAEGDATLGPKLQNLSEIIGSRLQFAVLLSQSGATTKLAIEKLKGDAGEASGTLIWQTNKSRAQTLAGDISAEFSPTFEPGIQAMTGPRARLTFRLLPVALNYQLDANLETPKAALLIEKAQTDLESRLNGLLTLQMKPDAELPVLLKDGVTAQASADLNAAGLSTLQQFHIESPSGLDFEGEARFNASSKGIALGGDLSAAPKTVAAATSAVTVDKPIRAAISVSGTMDRLSGKIDIDSPSIAGEGGAIPPSTTTIQFVRKGATLSADISGRAKSAAGSLKGRVELDGDAITVSSLALQAAAFALNGSASYDGARQTAAIDLSYRGDHGAEPWPGVKLTGEIEAKGALDRRGAAGNRLALTARNIALGDDIRAQSLTAQASGPAKAIQFEAHGDGLLLPAAGAVDSLAIGGEADLRGSPEIKLTTLNAIISGLAVALKQPAQISFDKGLGVKGLAASLGRAGSLSLDADLSKTRWAGDLVLVDAPLPRGDGYASLTLNLDTDRPIPARGELSLRASISKENEAAISGPFSWDGDTLRFRDSNPKNGAEISLALPVKLKRTPSLSIETAGQMSGAVDYAGRVEEFAPFLPTSLQSLEGALTAHAVIEGTIDSPKIDGRVTLAKGAYTELASGLSFTGIEGALNARASNDETTVAFDFSGHGIGQSGKTLTLAGRTTLGAGSRIDAEVTAKGARFSTGPIQSASLSGAVKLAGPLDAIKAEGALTVDELNASLAAPSSAGLVGITVVSADQADNSLTAPKSAAAPAPPIVLDITVSADDRIFVRGRGLESEWTADLRASGDAREPLIMGSASLKRGYLDFSGRRFTLTKGQIDFDKLQRNNPTLDIRAEYAAANNVTAAIEITGRAQSPSVSLTSTPPLPTNDVMALVLFGKQTTDLTAMESLQVAAALAQLSGVGPFGGSGGGITGVARRTLGLDLLNVDIGANAGESKLEVGKYVAQGLFVSATQDVQGKNGSVRVQYDITPSITVETQLQQDGQQTVSANWKHDF
ncbi:MAG: hypothetical protein GC153_03135 [Alphaproteobacteria bacterium]|nr:hypothetical protein [Alphaproteobacteria bacterium]